MTITRALLDRRPEGRAIRDNALWNEWGAGETDSGVDTASGARVTRNTALGLSAVWACVRVIADTIATLPIDTYTLAPDGEKKPFRPRPVWLDDPNPEQTPAEFWFGVFASLLLDGNAFLYTVRNQLQEVVRVWVIDPEWVQVRREWVAGELILVYYVMVGKGQQSPIGPLRIPAGPDMFHVTAFNPNSNWPRGLSPLEVARQMFGGGIANQEMGARFYGQGMNASGVVEVPNDMTIDQARELKSDFARANGGFRKMHLPPVLTGGATWKQIQVSPEQAQFLESRQFVVQDVARWFGVPLWLIQSTEKTTSWGTGVEQQGIGFATYTLGSWTTKVQDALRKYTMLPFHPEVVYRWNLKKLLRGDHQSRAAYYGSMRQWGAMSANDVRREEDMPTIGKQGDIYLTPINMQDPAVSDPASVPKTTLPATQQQPGPEGPEGDEDDDDDA